jgi:hypothetical protein
MPTTNGPALSPAQPTLTRRWAHGYAHEARDSKRRSGNQCHASGQRELAAGLWARCGRAHPLAPRGRQAHI